MSDENTLAMLAGLPSTTGYTPKDRFADFRKVFDGTPEGRRVLSEILSWGHMLKPSMVGSPVDPYLTHMRDGERNIALRLLATVNNEPQEKPQVQTRRKVK